MSINTTDPTGIKRIVILGGGVTGWTAAAALAKGLRNSGIIIVVIEDPAHTQADLHCEAATPTCIAFHQWLGLSEQDLLSVTGASFLLATQFNAWSDPQQNYFMPFGDHGFMLNRIDFPHYVVNRARHGYTNQYDEYSLAAMAAKQGRFCHPSTQASSLFSTLNYGLTLNTQTYSHYLRAYAQQSGVEYISAETSALIQNAEGYIEAIKLTNIINRPGITALNNHESSDDEKNGVLAADFYIDCTGAQGEIIEKTLQVEWQSLGHQLPLTHVASHKQPIVSAQALPSHRELRTGTAGWVQKLSSQTHTEQQYFYHADFTTSEQAYQSIEAGDAVQIKPISTGRRANFWHKNSVALGEAAGNLSALGVGNLYLVHSALLRFLTLFPRHISSGFNAREFNRLTHLEYDHIEDFNVLHYHLVAQQGSAYWQQVANAPRSERLLHKLELFKQRCVIPAVEGETFSSGVWTSLLLGNGLWPKRSTPLIDTLDANWIEQQLEKMKTLMRTAADAMPTQSVYLNQHGLRHAQ